MPRIPFVAVVAPGAVHTLSIALGRNTHLYPVQIWLKNRHEIKHKDHPAESFRLLCFDVLENVSGCRKIQKKAMLCLL